MNRRWRWLWLAPLVLAGAYLGVVLGQNCGKPVVVAPVPTPPATVTNTPRPTPVAPPTRPAMPSPVPQLGDYGSGGLLP